jgi:hypothetical protein
MATAAVALVGAMVLGGVGEVEAQSGSRLCGYQTTATEPNIPGLAVAIVYEARKAETAYDKKCDEAIKKIKKKKPDSITVTLDSGRTVDVKLSWEKVEKKDCGHVGKNFEGEGISQDICEHMKANHAYKIVKTPGQAATFEKL